MGILSILKKEMYFRYYVWKHVRAKHRWKIWPEFYTYRREYVSAEEAMRFYSVWYLDTCSTYDGFPVETSSDHGKQVTFGELLKNPRVLSRKLLGFPFVRVYPVNSWAMIKKFTLLAVRDSSGTTVVLDGNRRLLAALASGSFPVVSMLVLEGKEFSKMSVKHPDLGVLK
jgi:hypothetical protein